MPRRPGPSINRIFVAALLLVPWLVDAQQQQRHSHRQGHESPLEGLEPDASHTLEATRLPQLVETPLTHERRKVSNKDSANHYNTHTKPDASAIATLAPAEFAVRAPSSVRPQSIPTGGITKAHRARSLEDWEVEDFVLLATVDGKLYARDRKTGKERWSLEVEQPMVETIYHRRNRSAVEEDYQDFDDFLWIIEPSRDGSLYVYTPGNSNPGLVNLGVTMKGIVEELSPWSREQIVYTGEKKTELVTIDARNGNVLKWFGSTGSMVNEHESCLRPDALLDTESDCSPSAIITLGRTEYRVNIHGKADGHKIAELKFAEWTPNSYDSDLFRQYHSTLDGKYVHSSHDGGVLGFDMARTSNREAGHLFQHKFPSPVVRVFDVARPWGNEADDPELVVLPQPLAPIPEDEDSEKMRLNKIFLNHTDAGSWYALSGERYPLAVSNSKQAQCNQDDWWRRAPPWEGLNQRQLSEALVGLHSLDNGESQGSDRILSISPPQSPAPPEDMENDTQSVDHYTPTMGAPSYIRQIPRMIVRNFLEFIKNPMLIIVLGLFLFVNQRQARMWIGKLGGMKAMFEKDVRKNMEGPVVAHVPEIGKLPVIPEDKPIDVHLAQPEVEIEPLPLPGAEAGAVKLNALTTPDIAVTAPPVAPATEASASSEEPTPKKKNHRGRRGGVKHKKGRRAESQEPSQDGSPKAPPTVEDAVRDAKNLGQQTKLEPDIHTISHDPAEVSGPVIRIGALEVNTEKLIGTGSNGTMVFEGNFDGRSVAVKRMLIQFFDIASQETKLLRESDDHPNVIRYFAQQQAAGFLYIALELCPASLADVIEKPQLHRDLAQGGERDLPNVLYQITNGLQHLHNLRIVHRDLKPQNILVSLGKDGRPRLLVSDFGLCKKLEGEQSSFRATTAHAAGTSGWRAPELLLDDDAQQGSSMVDASTDGNSGSHNLVSSDLMPNRRATRAIDIFSLGLVFFYVLTKGSHPFDCGDRYMREVNIRKGKYNLRMLDVLGDFAFEARDLIGSMLAPEPKLRPQARQVMAHPFFWSAKKRLNFLCDVSDHFEKECRDPPSPALQELERWAPEICRGDFLKPLGKEFVDSMGKQRKYTGTRLLDLLRALRNKKNHYEDMSDKLKKDVGPLPEGYLSFWTRKFPNLLITCWNVVYEVQWEETDRFREYYLPAGL